MATSTITNYTEFPPAVKYTTGKTITVDVSQYEDDGGTGGFMFLVVGRSWVSQAASSYLFILSGIQKGAFKSASQIVKDTYGATVAWASNTSITITFYNASGGTYSIIPLYTRM